MFTFRTPKAVSSYSDQAHKARLRERFFALFQKLFYYRPIDGEERQLDKKKLLFIGISFLSIAFVTSYIPHIGDWFAKTIQPSLPFQQQQTASLPELAPELLLQEIPKAIEVVSPVDEALVDEALQPEGESEVVTSLDEQEEEPLNILDYLFKAEDIIVEEAVVPAPVPAPIIDNEIVIDPFPIEAMPPEIRAQLGNSPPLEDLVGPNRGNRTVPELPKEDDTYRGSTGVFREQNRQATFASSQLNIYSDDVQPGSSINVDNSQAGSSISADRIGNQNNLNVYADSSNTGTTLHIDTVTPRQGSFNTGLSNRADSFHEAIDNGSTSIFQVNTVSDSTSIFSSSPSIGGTQVFQSQGVNRGSANVFQTEAPMPNSSIQYQVLEANSVGRFIEDGVTSSMGIYRIEEQASGNSTVYRNNSDVNHSATFRVISTNERSASFQAPVTEAASLSIATTPSSSLQIYADELQQVAPSISRGDALPERTTVFAQNSLVGGSTYKRAIEAEIESQVQAAVIDDALVEVEIAETVLTVSEDAIAIQQEVKLEDFLNASDEIEATLVTGAILLPNSSQPIVAKAVSTWCNDASCPDLVFIGSAEYRNGNRAEIRFDKAVLDGVVQTSDALALGNDKTIGLPVSLSDTTPALAQDLARGALSGVAAYANALASQVQITNTATSSIEQSSVPSIETFVLGNLAKLFATQPEQTAVVRIAELKAGDSLVVLYGVSEGSPYERYSTPFRFSN